MCYQVGECNTWRLPWGKSKPATNVEPFHLSRESFCFSTEPFHLWWESLHHTGEPCCFNTDPFQLSPPHLIPHNSSPHSRVTESFYLQFLLVCSCPRCKPNKSVCSYSSWWGLPVCPGLQYGNWWFHWWNYKPATTNMESFHLNRESFLPRHLARDTPHHHQPCRVTESHKHQFKLECSSARCQPNRWNFWWIHFWTSGAFHSRMRG